MRRKQQLVGFLALTTALAAIALMTGGVVLEHLLHHAAHARADETALLSDPGALPRCRGEVPADRITDLASIEE
jgi:hypothetical protein